MIEITNPPAADLADAIRDATSAAKDEIRAADAKADTLLPVSTLILAGLVTYAGTRLGTAAMITAWTAAAFAAVALILLLLVILPRLGGARPGEPFPDHVPLLQGIIVPADRQARLRLFSILGVTKHYYVRVAVCLLLASVLLLAAATVITAV